MVTRDLIDNITAIVTRPDLEGQPDEVRGDIAARAEDERAVLAGQLRLARDEGGEDPLLAVVERARDRMLAAERDLRLLLAYAREFAEPRPYRLEDLARAEPCGTGGREGKGWERISPPAPLGVTEVVRHVGQFLRAREQGASPFVGLHQAEFAHLPPNGSGICPIRLPVEAADRQGTAAGSPGCRRRAGRGLGTRRPGRSGWGTLPGSATRCRACRPALPGRAAGPAASRRPPWCGECDPATRMLDFDTDAAPVPALLATVRTLCAQQVGSHNGRPDPALNGRHSLRPALPFRQSLSIADLVNLCVRWRYGDT